MKQIKMVFNFECEICGGEMNQVAEGVYKCSSNPKHTFKDVQGIGVWTGDEYIKRFFSPSPFEHLLNQSCYFCPGDMVNVGDSWICNKDLKHRMKESANRARWQKGFQEPIFEELPTWAA